MFFWQSERTSIQDEAANVVSLILQLYNIISLYVGRNTVLRYPMVEGLARHGNTFTCHTHDFLYDHVELKWCKIGQLR